MTPIEVAAPVAIPVSQVDLPTPPVSGTGSPVPLKKEDAAAAAGITTTAPTELHIKKMDLLSRFRLDGKVAVVTGGARGLGFSMAEGMCSSGLSAIAILDLQADLGDSACKALTETYGVKANFYAVDVRNEDSVSAAMNQVAADFGRLDILICSAGIADIISAEEYTPAKFRRVIDINLNGSFVCAQAAGKHMIAGGRGGSVVFIGSMSGSIVNWPQPQSAYNASKAGVVHLMKSLSAEWAKYNIRCNSISPGYMDTPLNTAYEGPYFAEWKARTPMGRLGQPEELAGAALWLASDASSFCTGSNILIDGGYTVL
ncbi:NAD(P)-binding protein [Dipodascopsis tothii]|uniref:NAD(P)-binding protein n=1 Tax=Dipodascopsis tothii TaxID=44089 RepID=UPI0034CE5E72